MPRQARIVHGGVCYHVLNRANGDATLFAAPDDYRAFLALMDAASERVAMPMLAYCIMPNHIHLVLRPKEDGDLGRWMQWLMTSHVRRRHKRLGTAGHVWQGRYKSFPIQEDGHLLTVLRYVERNPVRAGLVERARDWAWSSAPERALGRAARLAPPPLPLPDDWNAWVDRAQTGAEIEALRRSIRRGSPYGGASWQAATARALGLESSLRPRGRPPKEQTQKGDSPLLFR